ncbi:MAG TPA: hypothetical protein PKD86_02690 [Gemmatales bacterium]|nr:hypothetical protein [Gemmatales bacterium]
MPAQFSRRLPLALILLAFLLPTLGSARAWPRSDDETPKDAKPAPSDALVTTQHRLELAGQGIEDTAAAGHRQLQDGAGKPTAKMFFMAYTRTGTEARKRPICFTFNGGPGSSSVWLHLGAYGPRRVQLGEQGELPRPPYDFVPNEGSILDATDLVFIDPVTTGFSRMAPGREAKEFHGVQQDIASVGEFIRLYLTRFQRWESPKYVAGESYGTTRAAGLAAHLLDRHGISLNGVILVSAVLNFQTLRSDEGNDLPYLLYFPSYAATAWFHRKLGPTEQALMLPELLKQAEEFALGPYLQALAQGTRLGATELKQVASNMARLTGLDVDYVLRANLRIEPMRFMKELRRQDGKTVGRFDSRYIGQDGDGTGATFEYDPSYAAVQAPYTQVFNQYVRQELKFESDLVYEILTGKVQPWDYGDARNRYLNMAPGLRRTMAQNPHMEVFLASGIYDLATPYFAADYTLDHLSFDPAVRRRMTVSMYEAGHMMYLHRPSLLKLRADTVEFIKRTSAP